MRSMYLDNNALNGSVPDSMQELKSLQHLHLENNQLQGSPSIILSELTSLGTHPWF